MSEASNAPEQLTTADTYNLEVSQRFAEMRLAAEQAVGGATERVFERYADSVERDEQARTETLKLEKEWKLGEWADVNVTRHTSDGARTTTLSFWATSPCGWGSAIRYVEAPGDAEGSWQPGRLVACHMRGLDKDTQEPIVVEAEKPASDRLPDPTSNMHVAYSGNTWVTTLGRSYTDRSQGDLASMFRARGIRYIEARIDKIKPVVKRIEHDHPVAAERVETVAKKVGEIAARAGAKVQKIRSRHHNIEG